MLLAKHPDPARCATPHPLPHRRCSRAHPAAPPGLSALTRLTHLSLGGNFFDAGDEGAELLDAEAVLPAACSTLSRLQLLDLSGCGLEQVPPVLEVRAARGSATGSLQGCKSAARQATACRCACGGRQLLLLSGSGCSARGGASLAYRRQA